MEHPPLYTAASSFHGHSMSQRTDRGSGFPHRITQAERSQYKSTRSGLDRNAVGGGREFDLRAPGGVTAAGPFSEKLTKMNEKELLHGLNDRFAGFIEKVRHLEHQNQLLEREIEEIRGKEHSSSSLEQEYGPELGELRKLVSDITHQKHQIEIEHQNLEEELYNLRKQYDGEALNRSNTESDIMVLKKDISDAYQAKLQLDKKAQSLVDEIHFLKRNHEAEVSEMTAQIQDAQVTVKANEFGKADLTAALRDIRAQLEGHAVSDLQQAGDSFRSKFAKLTEAADTKREELKAAQQEIQEYRRRLQAKNVDLDCAKGTREAMEKQLREVEDRHNEDMIYYQDTIKQLENELINAKFDMSGYLREYQDLLNVKMALDVEILSYRKLLEGEEARLFTISDTHLSMPYIYRQSPVYTLPRLSREGGPPRRAEPQYKFVEEIITETTREIEMSEFEETGSEETVGGEGEEGCVKTETGSSEAEEGAGNKDSPKEDGEQTSDSQQNQVEPVENAEHRDNDDDTASPCDKEDGEKGDKVSDEAEVVDNKEDTDTDINTHSEVQVTKVIVKDENEQHDSVAQNMKEEIEDTVSVEKVLKDGSSKPEDSKQEVPLEGGKLKEIKNAKSEDDKKDDALTESKGTDLKDSVGTAQAEKPKDETSAQECKDSDNPESSSVVKVNDEALSLAAKPVEETPDLAAEQSSLSNETVEPEKPSESKGEETLSVAPKCEEKEYSSTEPMAVRESETVNATIEDKVPKSSQDATHDDHKEQDEELALKSHLKSLPKVEDETSNADKIQPVELLLPRNKIAPAAETKDLQQVAPDSSQIQITQMSEGPENLKDPEGASKKVEDVKSKDPGEATKSQTEGKSEEAEVAEIKTTIQMVQDTSTLSLKEKTADRQISEVEEVKIQNGVSNGDEALSLAAKPVEETPDLAAEQSSLSNEKVELEKPSESKGEETLSVAPKCEEKEYSSTEPMAVRESETVNATIEDKVPKSSQDATHDDYKEQDEELALKSHLKSLPKVEDETSNADKIQPVELLLPRNKLAPAAETKDLQQVAPDSSQIQITQTSEGPENLKDPEGASKKVEDVKSKDSGEATKSQTEGKSEEAEVAEIKTTIQMVQDTSTLSLKEKTADRQISEVKEVKIENGVSNGVEALSLAAKPVEETPDLAAEQSSLSNETVEPEKPSESKGEETLSVAPKCEEKEYSSTEPMAVRESETVNATIEDKVPKSSQDATHDDYKEQDEELALKSHLKSLPKVEDETSNADKIQPVELLLPRNKIAPAAETKDLQQVAPDSSQIQITQTSEGPENLKDLEGASKKVEDVKSKDPGEATKSQTEGKSEEAEVAEIRTTIQMVQDTSTLSLKEKTADRQISEVEEVKIQNGVSNGDEALSLAAKPVEETPDLAAEQSSLSNETVEPEKPSESKGEETLSVAPKCEEKEYSSTEPMAVRESETVNATIEDKVPKSSQDATHDDHKEQDEELVLKSHLKSLPKVEDETSNADIIQPVELLLPRNKIAPAAETKDLQQVAPDSSQIQITQMSEGPENLKDPEGASKKVEDVKSKDSGEATKSQTEGKSEEAEVAKIKTTIQMVQDTSTLSLKEKTADRQISEVKEVKIENGESNGDEGVKVEKDKPVSVEAQAETGKEKHPDAKGSV